MPSTRTSILWAVLAAAFYALNAPLSKWLLADIPPTMMAALLYLGAGTGMTAVRLIQRRTGTRPHEAPLTRQDLPYTVGMVVLDIAAPIFLMIGLTKTTAANASLLNNFEIVATALIALLAFGEVISRRLWAAIGLVTLSSILLSVEDAGSFSFSIGSVFVLLVCTCWGLENNCTRSISDKDPLQIVVIKGFGSGGGSLVIALLQGERLTDGLAALGALALGFVAYGLSIFFTSTPSGGWERPKPAPITRWRPFWARAFRWPFSARHPAPSFWSRCCLWQPGPGWLRWTARLPNLPPHKSKDLLPVGAGGLFVFKGHRRPIRCRSFRYNGKTDIRR